VKETFVVNFLLDSSVQTTTTSFYQPPLTEDEKKVVSSVKFGISFNIIA
jgi:hypothetical protein